MDLLLPIFILLILSRLLGSGAERLGQSSSVGEVLTGVLLAALVGLFGSRFPMVYELRDSVGLEYVADIAIFFLVLTVGVELKPREILAHSGTSLAIALGGALVPFAGGCVLAWAFLPDSEIVQAQILLVGTASAITAVPATVKIFTEFNMLHTRLGQTVIAAAVFDDILGLFFMAILTAMIASGGVPDMASMGWLLAKVAAFFVVVWMVGFHIYPRLSKHLHALDVAAIEFSVLMMVTFAYAIFADIMGLHWIIGVLTAGLFFEADHVGAKAYNEMRLTLSALTTGFLGPLFFAYIGLKVNLAALAAVPLFLGLLVLVALVGKLVGAGLPARLLGFSTRDAGAIGVSMGSRGVIVMVVVSIAWDAGLFNGITNHPVATHLLSSLVVMAVLTTLASPLILRRIIGSPQKK
jgi:Kef-type K+ transport system membrane component KefB